MYYIYTEKWESKNPFWPFLIVQEEYFKVLLYNWHFREILKIERNMH